MSTKYVLRRHDGKFWVSPGRWSDEYPDAHKFVSWKNASVEAMLSNPLVLQPISVYADYGLAPERVVLTLQPTILGEKP